MKNYKQTIYACFTGYIVQAVVVNFAPLLFLTFQSEYQIPLSQITTLISINFLLQLLIDSAAAFFVDKIGYRISIVAAHIFSGLGLIFLATLPSLLNNAFAGLLIAVITYAIGGGLLEVLISPIVEACPTDNKEKAMSMLHSFYSWGTVGVIGLSTLFFFLFGIQNWKILTLIWAILPIVNSIIFTKVPIASLIAADEKGFSLLQLFREKMFWLFMLIILCSGASEQVIGQWASTFVETSLHLPKIIGDLIGPMLFAICMGATRTFYGKFGDKINLGKMMLFSSISCCISYLFVALTASPILSIVGFCLSGLSIGILWPGTFSIASASIPKGGTTMFALFALFGDLGCSVGPAVVGFASNNQTSQLKFGILIAIVFPLLLIVGTSIFLIQKHKKRAYQSNN